MIGARIGPYEVTAKLGEGGMGEVYRARDTKLGRDVAIKVLPESVAHDPDRLARFQREAQVLASLNHPNIATLHGFEHAGATQALVMELVEGPTLADRIAEGPIPIDEALALAKQVVDALDAAHAQGIVHRDLKPANIKVRHDGTVKVLDFGLAKAIAPEGSTAAADAANSPTLTARGTQMGIIIGTAAYMAPEQARGKAVDKRADIWAFGCVLFEMVTGKRLFFGEDLTETLAAVVKENPSLEQVPLRLQRLLRKCLEKDPKRRLRDIGDAWDLIDESRPRSDNRQTPRRRAFPWAVAAAAIVLAGLAIAYSYMAGGSASPGAVRFHVAWPTGDESKSVGGARFFQISPDGKHLVIASENSLWIRAVDSVDPVRLDGTYGATYPFWSPDSAQVGFFQNSELKVISRTGGSMRPICPAPDGRGGTWGPGVIVFSDTFGDRGLFKVSDQGGTPTNVTPAAAKGLSDDAHRYPQFLPDGQRFLFLRLSSRPEVAGVYVGSVDGMTPVRVLENGTNALFARSREGGGHLLFARSGSLMAQPFDADRLTSFGTAFTVADGVGTGENTGHSAFSVHDDGTLVTAQGVELAIDLAWFNRKGVRGESVISRASIDSWALSASEKYVAMALLVSATKLEYDIWIQSTGGAPTRFTFGPVPGFMQPVWSPNDDAIAFASIDLAGQASYEVRTKRVDMSGEKTLYKGPQGVFLWQWSRDGTYLVSTAGGDIFRTSLAGKAATEPLSMAPALEAYGQISPNGRWLAYAAGPRNASQVFVQPIPATGAVLFQVSRGVSATMPRWRSDGKELYYRNADGMLMAVKVDTDVAGTFSFSTTHEPLFPIPTVGNVDRFTYQPGRDGSRFLVSLPSSDVRQPLTLILNWRAGKGQ